MRNTGVKFAEVRDLFHARFRVFTLEQCARGSRGETLEFSASTASRTPRPVRIRVMESGEEFCCVSTTATAPIVAGQPVSVEHVTNLRAPVGYSGGRVDTVKDKARCWPRTGETDRQSHRALLRREPPHVTDQRLSLPA